MQHLDTVSSVLRQRKSRDAAIPKPIRQPQASSRDISFIEHQLRQGELGEEPSLLALPDTADWQKFAKRVD